MDLVGKVIVVTGAARGIGAALCRRFAEEGAKAVVGADLDASGDVVRCDVSREADILRLIGDTETRVGPIDLFCSNAGIAVLDPDWDNPASAPDTGWARSWASQRDGPCLRRPPPRPAHGRARRRLLPQHGLRRRPPLADRQRPLFRHQARRPRLRRKPRDLDPRPQHQSLNPLPPRRRHRDAPQHRPRRPRHERRPHPRLRRRHGGGGPSRRTLPRHPPPPSKSPPMSAARPTITTAGSVAWPGCGEGCDFSARRFLPGSPLTFPPFGLR